MTALGWHAASLALCTVIRRSVPGPASSFAGALAVFVVVGCGDRLIQPRKIEGEYEAVQANGSTLPTNIFYYETPDRIRLLRGSLTLGASGTLLLVSQTAYVDPLGAEGTPASDTIRALYVVNGSSLEFSPIGIGFLALESPATIASDGSIDLTVLRPRPVSTGYGLYPVRLRFRR